MIIITVVVPCILIVLESLTLVMKSPNVDVSLVALSLAVDTFAYFSTYPCSLRMFILLAFNSYTCMHDVQDVFIYYIC